MNLSTLAAVCVAGLVAGCSALPDAPVRPALYDFGPGAVAPTPTDRRAPLPPLALAEVGSSGVPEGTNAVLYRLAYSNSQQLRPYAQARWSQAPALLVQQRLRETLGERRAILSADDGAAQVRDTRQGGKLPGVVRVDLEEFSQVFTSPTESASVVRVRATLVDLTVAGEVLLGQRVFIARTPAASADAPAGVAALAESTAQVARDMAQWLEQAGH